MCNGRTDSRKLVYHNTSRLKDGHMKIGQYQKQELPVVAMFVNVLGRNEQSLYL
jgi:hypothetical protein